MDTPHRHEARSRRGRCRWADAKATWPCGAIPGRGAGWTASCPARCWLCRASSTLNEAMRRQVSPSPPLQPPFLPLGPQTVVVEERHGLASTCCACTAAGHGRCGCGCACGCGGCGGGCAGRRLRMRLRLRLRPRHSSLRSVRSLHMQRQRVRMGMRLRAPQRRGRRLACHGRPYLFFLALCLFERAARLFLLSLLSSLCLSRSSASALGEPVSQKREGRRSGPAQSLGGGRLRVAGWLASWRGVKCPGRCRRCWPSCSRNWKIWLCQPPAPSLPRLLIL